MSLSQMIIENELGLRLGVFVGLLVAMGLWEQLAPRRQPRLSRSLHWLHNLALLVLNTVLMRLLFPIASVGVALIAQQQQWGLLNTFTLPPALALLTALVLLDLVIYLQHVVMHAVPLLWRLHRVHHADLDYDVTTGSRFHPLEIAISMLIKFVAIVALGPSVVVVIVFETILNGMAMFNHANVGLPPALEKVLRPLVVTPDMHRIHHSVEDAEFNRNFGFNLSCWDRLFGTYCAQPRRGQVEMEIGLRGYANPKQTNGLWGMLLLPFRSAR